MKKKIIFYSLMSMFLLFVFSKQIYANDLSITDKQQDSTQVRQFAYLIPNGHVENNTFLTSHYSSNGIIEANVDSVAFLQEQPDNVSIDNQNAPVQETLKLGLEPITTQEQPITTASNLKLGLQPLSTQDGLSKEENSIVLIEDKKEEPKETTPPPTNSNTEKKSLSTETTKKEETKVVEKKEETKKETEPKTVKKEAFSASDDELDMLAKIIYAEAGDEPYQGKVAVGAVVLNRVKSGKFPDSIKEVIFAQKQFSPVSDGSYAKAKPGDDEYKAAKAALSGEDPTDGALYFYAPSLTKTRWHETLDYTVTIGGHKFYK